ncbi:Hypothetical_protein [Hexamita inflata]|uniref:Hypothetical_protein n=1 Tax=Hexamita inflata TaxID=28002 RepID=A0AA86TS12_9EUKA|nr:Hypothetical protein HINF_LOCUS13845 [Hexamita inflata]
MPILYQTSLTITGDIVFVLDALSIFLYISSQNQLARQQRSMKTIKQQKTKTKSDNSSTSEEELLIYQIQYKMHQSANIIEAVLLFHPVYEIITFRNRRCYYNRASCHISNRHTVIQRRRDSGLYQFGYNDSYVIRIICMKTQK